MDNVEYREQANKIVASAAKITDAVRTHGFGTNTTLVVLGELMSMTQVSGTFMQLPSDQRDEFFAEVWDAAIGNEPNALIKQVGFFSGDALEMMSDGIKAGALSYFNRQVA